MNNPAATEYSTADHAAKLGAKDGHIAATATPFDCDPTGAFILRAQLDESTRTAFVAAFNESFVATLAANKRFAAEMDMLSLGMVRS